MAKLFLPDNTVLINFALIHRMDLLGELINTRGCWCISVARECDNSARYPKLSDLTQAAAIFGTPLVPDQAEHVETQMLRTNIGPPRETGHQHLGEAETIAVMSRRGIDGLFLTDDNGARTLAAHHGITAVTTWDLLRLACRTNKLTQAVLVGYLRTLKSEGRGHPPSVFNHQHSLQSGWTDAAVLTSQRR